MLWKILWKGGDAPHYFAAAGRDAEVPQARLTLDRGTHRLAADLQEGPGSARQRDRELALMNALTACRQRWPDGNYPPLNRAWDELRGQLQAMQPPVTQKVLFEAVRQLRSEREACGGGMTASYPMCVERACGVWLLLSPYATHLST